MKDMLPKIQNFEDFQNLKGCFFWVNLIEFDSICIDLRRSTSIHIDPHSFASIWTLRFHRFFGYIKILTHFSLFIIMNEGYAPQNPEFWGFSKFERLFFLSEFDWIRFNLHRSASIYIDPHRSTLICLDLNLKISSIFRIYQDFDSLFTFHMGEVNNWPLRRQSDSVGLGNFSKNLYVVLVVIFKVYFLF